MPGSGWASASHAEACAVASCSLNGIWGSGGLCGSPSPRSVGAAAGAAHGWGGGPGDLPFPTLRTDDEGSGQLQVPGELRSSAGMGGLPLGGCPWGGFVALQPWSKPGPV